MLTPEYLSRLPDAVVKLWQQVEDDILRDIARRIAKMDGLTDTAAYQAFRLEQTRLLRQDIVKLLAKYSGKSETTIRRMMQEAATETLRSEDAVHTAAGKVLTPPNESRNLLNILNSGYIQTSNTWKNLTATTANTVTKQFENALDRAWLQVSSGAFTHQDAVKRAVDDLAQHMDGVTYPTGHHDTLEVAVRRAVLTGVNQTCAKLQMARIVEAGCEFVEVTAHEGAREDEGGGPADHAGWQGKVYHLGGAIDCDGTHYEDFHKATGFDTGPGLCGWNCRHNFHAFYPGISVPAYSEELLASYKARNIEYNGKMYTRYEINQMQRSLERKVRKSKQLWMAEKEAGQDSTAAAFKLQANRKKLSDFVKATGGKQYSYRTATWNTSTLPGKKFGRSEASKAGWDVRKAENMGLQKETLAKRKKDATMTVGGESMTISSIDSPIEQRHTGKGKPGAIMHYDASLTNRQADLLASLPEYDSRVIIKKSDISMADLSALTAKTGDEFALFTKEGERLVIRGSASMVNIDVQEAIRLSEAGYTWSGHTHPGTDFNCLVASRGDMEILKCFKQERSSIYNSLGEYLEFWKE